MKIINPQLICLIEEDTDIRDMLMTALSSEGFLANGFRTFPEAMSFLYNSLSPLSLLLANNAYSYHEWTVFKSELIEMERMKEAKFHTYHLPLNLPVIINEVTALLKNTKSGTVGQ